MFRLWLLSGLKLVTLAALVLSNGGLLAQMRDLSETKPWPADRNVIGLPDDNDEGDDEGDDCPASPAPIPKTGQTKCHDHSGGLIDCAGTGQDGEYQAGVSVDPRFTDNGDGTVTDNLTGLIWLRDADCIGGSTPWAFAIGFGNGLADPQCGLTDGSVTGDWRLPNLREMQSLMDYGQYAPALPAGHPFFIVESHRYWTSTTWDIDDPTFMLAWTVSVDLGDLAGFPKNFRYRSWLVRGGL